MWSVSAQGEAADAAAEADLHEKLAELLHGYGLVTSHFSGGKHNGPLPEPKPPKAAARDSKKT
jgi:hypothetical protein